MATFTTEQQDEGSVASGQTRRHQKLAAWITQTIEPWEDYRDANFSQKWNEYYRLWRGIWHSSDKNRKSERAKIISPAIQQAIEATVAELEEATFGRGPMWFDVSDDVQDQNPEDIAAVRGLLREDLEKVNLQHDLSRIFLMGAIYGTGIGKLIVERKSDKKLASGQDQLTGADIPVADSTTRVYVRIEGIMPDEFVIDPIARSVDEALGCAHVIQKPRHGVIKKQRDGIYLPYAIGSSNEPVIDAEKGETSSGNTAHDNVEIIEYYGKVPRALILEEAEEETLEDAIVKNQGEEDLEVDEDDLVEAMVTVANRNVVLRAVENPYLMKDRPILAYQHDVVPNRFHGRGVTEKGYNPQKALDAEMRARIDAMALNTYPVVAADATRLMRGQSMTVTPGKTFLTNGDPTNILSLMKMNPMSAETFHQTGDLERMVQMGTGAMDTATPTSISPRNQTASGMSMMQSAMIKRNKRAKRNIDLTFINPMLEKILHRYVQFAPERYPISDIKFCVRSTMGIMAREFEQSQLTNLLSIIPQDSPAFDIILDSIVANSSVESRDDLLMALQQARQPDPQAQQMQQMIMQLDLENRQLVNEKLKSESVENYAQAQAKAQGAVTNDFNAQTNRLNAARELIQGKQQTKE